MKLLKIIIFSVIALILVIIASLAFGARSIAFNDVIDAIISPSGNTFNALVVQERIPRTMFCLIAGASLGVSGALMQGITRNPIADPSILGVNTGSSLFVVCGIAFFNINTSQQYIWFALVGAVITTIFVYGIASTGSSGATPIKLALAGTATSAALASLVSAVVLPRANVMDTFRFWQVGSVSGASWQGIMAILPFVIVGFLLALFIAPALNALALGDEVATSLGTNVGITRVIGAIAGVILCACITALAGPISFVGLMVPHVIRLLSSSNLRFIIPMSAIGGAILLTLSDVIGRVLASPGELEVGIVTAFIGAPILIVIAMRVRGKAL